MHGIREYFISLHFEIFGSFMLATFLVYGGEDLHY